MWRIGANVLDEEEVKFPCARIKYRVYGTLGPQTAHRLYDFVWIIGNFHLCSRIKRSKFGKK